MHVHGGEATDGALRAAAMAAIALLMAEEEQRPVEVSPWTVAARPDGRSAGAPWPAGRIRWDHAERPR